jgi:hypothetical protein
MDVQEIYDAALAVINQHNSVVGEGNPGFVSNPEEFINCVKAAGGTSIDRLKRVSHEDILSFLPVGPTGKKATILGKELANLFRGKEETFEATKELRPISAKKADKMTLRELIEAYDPEEPTNPVGKRLQDISKGEKFIVFDNGRVVDVATSLKLLQEIKQGFNGRSNIEVNGEIKEVHALGEIPDNFVEENPLYKNRPLRPDGTCDQTNRSWNGVTLRVRQLIRVAINLGALQDISIERAHDIMDLVMEPNSFDKLAKRYPAAAVEFKKLESLGKLPTLKLVLKGDKEAGRSKNPFEKGQKVEFKRDLSAYTSNRGGHGWTTNLGDTYTAFWKAK